MNEIDWFRSHVERCLQDSWEVPRVGQDPDGDYPFPYGTAACFVTIVVDGEPTFVRVWALAVMDIKRSPKLLVELNEINATSLTARVWWADGSVLVEQTLLAEAVSAEPLGQACAAVGAMADDFGLLLASTFGGHTPYAAVDELDEAATES